MRDRFRRRRVDRRVWALQTLRRHCEVDGSCGFCARTYQSTSPGWPCAPARVAMTYAGLGVVAPRD